MGIVVIGAGQAGEIVVETLRKAGYDGALTLIGDEPHPPYQRPPLSKAYLLGDMELERLFLRPLNFYDDQGITLRLGQTVTAINRAARTVHLADGGEVGYETLVLTTGSRPRQLPERLGGGLNGVYTVRSLADVDAMAPEFREGARVLILGGGYIGLEAAAVAAKRGLRVTLVEMAERILQRVACPETAEFFRKYHTEQGVEVREGVGLERLAGTGGRVSSAVLTDGSTLEVDFVVAGIGIAPETALAEACGLEIENGIRVDAQGLTSDPHIYAAGDCTSFPYRGGRIRLESVPNAIDQATVVAQAIMGQEVEYIAKPWFWSDQYDIKLQIAGLNAGYDRIVVRDGGDGTLSHWYFKGNTLLAVDAMNDSRAYMVGKRLIETGKSPTEAQLTDPETDLKRLLKEL